MKFESVKGKFSIQIPGNLIEDIPTQAAFILRSQTWYSFKAHNKQQSTALTEAGDRQSTKGESLAIKAFHKSGSRQI